MPRQWGLTELQRYGDEAFKRGFDLGRTRAILADSDYPHVEELLAAIGIEHPTNVEFDPTKRRSWHE